MFNSYRSTFNSAEATSDSRDQAARLQRVQTFARWMDAKFRVPGTPVSFGLDSLLGLIPRVGDAVTAAMSVWFLNEARQAGVSKIRFAKMVGNSPTDLAAGAVPVVGDLIDVHWKSNVRNARLLEQHLLDNNEGLVIDVQAEKELADQILVLLRIICFGLLLNLAVGIA